MLLRNPSVHIVAILLGSALLAGCDAARRVPQGEHLLVRNRLHVDDRAVDREQLQDIIRQKPNKRILGIRFYLYMHNLVDPTRNDAKRARKHAHIQARNEVREARGRELKPLKRTFGDWMREVVGEAPVVLDSSLTSRTSGQMRLFMQKEGWFHAQVSDTTVYHGRRAEVAYHIEAGRQYNIRNVSLTVDDPAIKAYVAREWDRCKVKPGQRFDADVLDEERSRIADQLRHLGYLYFTRELVVYDADTTVGDHQVDVVIRLERPFGRKDRGLKGTREGTIHYLEEVVINTTRRDRASQALPLDSLYHRDHLFLYRRRIEFKPGALLGAVFLNPGERYDQADADLTYRRLTALRVFDRVDVSYDTANTSAPDRVNVRMDLLPGKRQSLSLEGFGTNRGGFLGTSVSLAYRHRNLFRSMGSIQAQMTLGLEAQQSFTGRGSVADQQGGLVRRDVLFNTVEIGPEVNLRFPSFLLPIRRERFARSSAPRTALNMLYNYQRRPDYTRTLARMSFGYEWNESRFKTWGIYPFDLNVIKIPERSTEFLDYLQSANDPVLTDSYTDHLIVGGRVLFTFNNQEAVRKRHVYFYRAVLETSGNMINALQEVRDAPLRSDTAGNRFYTLDNIRYAHFVKLDNEFRYLRSLHERSSIVFRVAVGAGLPLSNLNVLPFETSFFVGGANGLRAWRARSIGPGSYSAPLVAFDRIGEARLEGNVEYRFGLVGFFEGALFCDVGNIWNLREDPRKPGSGLSPDLLSELAVGTGVGARLNFDFLIIRFDLGLQTKDPSLPQGERWLFQPKDRHNANLAEIGLRPYQAQVNFNLGIGYPF